MPSEEASRCGCTPATYITTEIHDQGEGMPAAVKAQLFALLHHQAGELA
jgi:hypothetical protein